MTIWLKVQPLPNCVCLCMCVRYMFIKNHNKYTRVHNKYKSCENTATGLCILALQTFDTLERDNLLKLEKGLSYLDKARPHTK
jgi:hypothetical protein